MAALHQAIERADASATGILELSKLFGDKWDALRILQGFKPESFDINCPFGSHWSADEREALAKAGNLTLIILLRDKQFFDLVDYRGDWAQFEVGDDSIPRNKAQFVLDRTAQDPNVRSFKLME